MILSDRTFPDTSADALRNAQLRRNLRHATTHIRARRAEAVAELSDWEQLRAAGESIRRATLAQLDTHLLRLEAEVTSRGGVVHWARNADEANRIIVDLARRHVEGGGEPEVVKVKSMTSQELRLNEALQAQGIEVLETDLAELIVQLAGEAPSHILVPAIHKNRSEIRDLFQRHLSNVPPGLSDDPAVLANAARAHLRRTFLRAGFAISGANFAVADSGTVVVVESEGNGRMCISLPRVLVTVMGIDKVVPTWTDLEVFLQLLPRSSTGERMNPYTSTWSGVTPGDGPEEFHLVLLDNGRTEVLGDPVGRDTLHCIRCSACLNVCPVYERTGGHAYGSVYPGPIGAILSPQLVGITGADTPGDSLPYASTLCGACADVCPVRIDIPSILVHLRTRHVETAARRRRFLASEAAMMRWAAWTLTSPRRWAAALRVAQLGRRLTRSGLVRRFPGAAAWSAGRDVPSPARRSFRQWWVTDHHVQPGDQHGGVDDGERS
jgi:L-lactate dehydrogenase complex protein LldF